jgi:RHS repeat-associated protein
VYLSYENQSNNWVYFDDFKVTHTKGRVIQYNEYYPFGLPTANSWTREDATVNNFLANGGTEWNATSNFYDLDYRQYDPILGRMNGIDPMAGKYASLSPYNYSFNDPVSFTDPSGADPADYYFNTGSSQYGGVPGLTYDDYVPNYPREYVCGQCWRVDSPGAVNFMSTAMGYGGSITGGWRANTFGGIPLPYYGQMRADAQAVRNNQMSPEAYASRYGDYMGSGIGGLTNAMLSVNAASINYNAGTFTYEFGGKMYGGTYHTTNGIVTSTATALVMQSVTGGWEQIGDLRVNDYEKSISPIGNFITNHLEFEMSGQFTFGAQATIVPSPKGLLPLPYSRGSELSFDVNLGSVVLLGGSYNSNKGKNKTTIDDTNFVQSFGISFRGFSLDGERILSPFGKNDSWAIGLTFKGWGMEYNSSNELSVGYMPKFKWALGIGTQVSPKAIIKY